MRETNRLRSWAVAEEEPTEIGETSSQGLLAVDRTQNICHLISFLNSHSVKSKLSPFPDLERAALRYS